LQHLAISVAMLFTPSTNTPEDTRVAGTTGIAIRGMTPSALEDRGKTL